MAPMSHDHLINFIIVLLMLGQAAANGWGLREIQPLLTWDFEPHSATSTPFSATDLLSASAIGHMGTTSGKFNGNSSMMLIPSSVQRVMQKPISVVTWVCPQQRAESRVDSGTIWSIGATEGLPEHTARMTLHYSNTGTFYLVHSVAAVDEVLVTLPYNVVPANEPYMVAVTVDPTNFLDGLSVYVDGFVSASGPAAWPSTPVNSSMTIAIGATVANGQSSKFFFGYIDDLVVYEEALDVQHIQELLQMNAPLNCP